MTISLANIALSPADWTDVCAVYPSTVNADLVVRYLSATGARIVHGGAKPASLNEGDALNPNSAVYANTDHLWVTGVGAMSVTLI